MLSITSLLTALDSSTTKGFLPHHDLLKFPVVAEIIPYFILEDMDGEDSYVKGVNSMESYKWLYNLIILNLYYLCVDSLSLFEVDEGV